MEREYCAVGYELPALVITPLAQLSLTYWIVLTMSRRLNNPLDPAVRRKHAYLVLLVFDLIVAGACYTRWQNGEPQQQLLYQFGLVHLSAALILLLGIVPGKAALQSWLWRFRNRKPWLRDSAFDSRSEITMVLPVFCLIGGIALLGGFVLPTSLMQTAANRGVDVDEAMIVLAVSSAVLVAFGMLHQMCAAFTSGSGVMIYAIGLLLINIVPIVIAAIMIYPQQPRDIEGPSAVVASLSPAAFYMSHLEGSASNALPAFWLITAATCLGCWCYLMLRKWLKIQGSNITEKITQMESS